ncbi:MAG TPA: hypothetical protein VK176_12330 [Phycisphaerales bacterium]|nr:hypothetical protein [Phycisphaerales bacterium]
MPSQLSIVPGEPVSLADLVVTYCHERDVTCPHCSYSLRNAQSPVCPECGSQLLLHIHPRMGVSPLSSTLGLFGVVIGLMMSLVSILGSLRLGWTSVGISVVIFIGSVVQLSLWDRYFRRIRRHDRAKLPVYIMSGWLIPVIVVVRWILRI